MTNNLRGLKKELKSFAKRVKDFKYTDSALIAFLLTGIIGLSVAFNAYSAQDEIETQRKAINTSITDIHQQFKRTKSENDKLMKNYNLELIQLMEQGDHVVKSPWSSWQYGINGIYNDWQGHYKGRGDKTADVKYERDKTLSKYKYNRNPAESYGYGNTTELGLKQEPNAVIPVSASLTPLIPRIKQANVSMAVDISDLPSFTPRTVTPPSAPMIAPMKEINTPSFSMKSSSLSNWGESHFDDANTASNGVIESVAILGGDFNVERLDPGSASRWKYNYTGYRVKNAFNTGNMTSDYIISGITNILTPNSEITVPSRTVAASNSKSGFLRMTNDSPVSQGSTLLNQATFTYTNSSGGNYVRELAHLDMHGSNSFSTERGKLLAITGLKASVVPNFDDVSTIAQNTTGSTKSQTFINAGKIIIKGDQASFTNSYDHDWDDQNRVASVINTEDGEVSVSPLDPNNKGSAVFIVSPEIDRAGNPQIFYNAGKINLHSKKSAIFFLNPNGDVRWNHDGSFHERNYENNRSGLPDNDQDDPREITIVNRARGNNKIISYGDGNVGIYLKTSKYIKVTNLDFRTQNLTDYVTKNGAWAPMVMYGDNNIGLYAPKDTESQLFVGDPGPIIGNFAVSIGDSNGNYFLNNNDDAYIDSSYGIFSSVNIDLSNDVKDIKSGHQITINKNSKNGIGVLTSNNAEIKLGAGKIELNGGFDNTGIVIGGSKASSGDVKDTDGSVIGDVISINGISNADRGNRAIYAWDGNNRGNSVEVNAIKSENTINSIAIVAEKNAKITVNGTASSNPSIIGTTDGTGFEYGVKIDGSKYVYDSNRVVSATDATSTDNVGAAYANNEAVITINRTALPSVADGPNISIKGGTDKHTNRSVGFGLFADNKAKINAQKNWIKVKDGSTNVASLNKAKVDLTGATVDYEGEGYALYTDQSSGTNAIDMTGATLELRGKAVGYVNDQNHPGNIKLTGTTINVYDDEVIVADLQNTSGTTKVTVNVENKTSPGDSLKDQLLGGSGVNVVDKTSATPNGKFKYAVVDDANINIKSAIDKSGSGSTNDSETFTKRFLYQNSRINVDAAGSVKAELNTTQLNNIDASLTAPVGLAVTASAKSTNTSTTGINNKGTVSADRTDAGQGGIGLYVDYGFINNEAGSVVNVEKTGSNGPNDKAIGIFGTNSTNIVNKGAVNAGGKKSIGILGLSYRIDKTKAVVDPSTEKYFSLSAPAGTYGNVNVINDQTGTITMDDDSAVGLFVKNNSAGKSIVTTKFQTLGTNKGTITINGNNNSVGMGADNGIITNDTTGKIYVNGTKSVGMYGTKDSNLINNGEINVAATSAGNESIGMFTDDANTPIVTAGKINVGQSSYGIYGKNVTMNSGEINVADDGVGVYATGSNVNLNLGKITVANNNAVGVYIADDATNPVSTTVNSKVDMSVGNTDSFGYLIIASKNATNLTTEAPNDVHVGEKSVYIYSNANQGLGGNIINKSNLVMDQNNAYGIYSSQDFSNQGNIDLTSGVGNIGLYSTQGVGTNTGHIKVGPSNTSTKQYGIGMATGYYNETAKATSNQGTIINEAGGVIDVSTDNSVGMYAVGAGSKAINKGTINLSGDNTTGMYIDRHAIGENYGTIQTTPTANGKGIKGVVVTNGGVIRNYGTINIQGPKNIGVYAYRGEDTDPTYKPYQQLSGSNSSTTPYQEGTATDQKTTGHVTVKVPPASLPSAVSINISGVQVEPSKVDTNIPDPKAPEVIVTDPTGITTLNLATMQIDHEHNHSNGEVSSIGMYVDTSGINYTKPIQGLSNLVGLDDVDLIFGTEAAKYLNGKAIQIGDNILKPYNDALGSVLTTGTTLNVNSGSLTWIAQPVESGSVTAPIKTVYLVKIPYTDFASDNDRDTYNFLDGLEQRYGVEGINSREKQIFNKLNSLGNGESHIFAQAVNEMKGYEYSNTQQRIYETGNALDKEFKYLHDEWRNPSKQNNKIKVFGQKDEYNTDTAGVIDYDSNAYGVAYVHEDETVKLGNSSGWYAGAVTNRFKFKDLGKSTEQDTMIKAGIFKIMSPYNDHNGSLRWTVAGDVFGGINNMRRKFWVVDDTFESKGDYYTYGAAFKTDLGYDIRLSERTHLRPYGALKMEYGRFTDVNEDRGEMNLEVKGNDYFSVKPEVGAEFKYVQPLAVRTQLSVGLSAAYENELGKLNRLNQARVRYTTADWYNLRNEKENRKGNGKFDLNIGIDNTRFGVTVNAGYDTKGENIRGGIGFRAIY
ncbi:autotransporter-associated N-terminal domain-containing protein [Leptotrichia sp.]